jgi:hypothetical protein
MATRLRIPPDAALDSTLAGADTRQLRAELRDAFERRRALNSERSEAERERNAAPRLDAASYAQSRRAGAPDPGARHVKEAEQHLADIQRRTAGEIATLAAIEADISAMRDARGEAWLADVDRKRADALAEATGAFDQLADAVGRVQELDVIAAWIRSGKPAAALPETVLPSGAPGQHHDLGRALASIGAAIRDWRPAVIEEDAEQAELETEASPALAG